MPEILNWYFIPLVILAGFGAGFINTLAGSGSLITLALMEFMGIPIGIANGTNRVGVLIQNIVAVDSFRHSDKLDLRGGFMLSVPAIVGAIIGARIAVDLNEALLRQIIGGLMVVMLFVIIVRPNRWLKGTLLSLEGYPTLGQGLIFFVIGMYGGFIQAGVGVFLLAGLVLGVGYDLVRANAVKNLIVLAFTIFALGVFVLEGQVWWLIGVLLALGNAGGAWIAAKVAVEKGADFVRWVLIAVVVISATRLLGLFDLVLAAFA